MELTATTELEAVNQLLKAVGETPVGSLEDLGFTDASIARDTLRVKNREVQTKGWYFNKDYSFYFAPDVSGEVVLPPNVMSVRPSIAEARRIIPRAGKLWNADDSTFVYAQDNGPTAMVVWLYEFETLPESARRYITVHAATQFQAQFDGNEQGNAFTKDDETLALLTLMEEERAYEPKANMFNDAADVSEVWTRA